MVSRRNRVQDEAHGEEEERPELCRSEGGKEKGGREEEVMRLMKDAAAHN